MMKATCDKCGTGFESTEPVAACPNCGEMQRVAKLRDDKAKARANRANPKNDFWVTAFASLITAAIIGIAVMAIWKAVPLVTSTASDSSAFEFVAEPSGGERHITGKIRNNGAAVSYVQIEFALYQGETRVGTAFDNLSSMGAGEEWAFNALALEPFDHFRMIEITSY